MAFVTIEDATGSFELIVFPRVFEESRELLRENEVLLISGSLSLREDEDPKVIADKIMLLQPDCERLPDEMRMGRPRKGRNKACPAPTALPERKADLRPKETEARPFVSETDPVIYPDQQKNEPSDHNMSLVIRCPETPSDLFIDAVRATCSYFGGSMPVYIFAEKEGMILDGVTLPSVASDSETIAILCRRFGSDNLCLI